MGFEESAKPRNLGKAIRMELEGVYVKLQLLKKKQFMYFPDFSAWQ
ncbi:hypothetical protein COLO4_06599 [Corchorus olitorius]|uniref:Uncharacterized protein n=1 Tax=Corchorus olitorius TaxID=93759 RepID=A0A1R3KMJ5_9ROSI|nr:hypothetical protein COLO4_06599 [Corchorus olitorius]